MRSRSKNKIDSMKKKAKIAYKSVRMKTTTGANVKDDVDLEVRIDLNWNFILFTI